MLVEISFPRHIQGKSVPFSMLVILIILNRENAMDRIRKLLTLPLYLCSFLWILYIQVWYFVGGGAILPLCVLAGIHRLQVTS